MARHSTLLHAASVALFALFALANPLWGCGGVDENPPPSNSPAPEPSPIDPEGGDESQYCPDRPDKERLGTAAYCDNWHEAIADEMAPTTPWGLPDEGVVSRNVRGFFATQHPTDGLDYRRCVLADIFAEVDRHVDVLRAAYFNLAPAAQLARSELATFLAFVYEEPATLPLLLDIANQPVPEFDPEFVRSLGEPYVMEGEADVRIDAVLAISDSAPCEGDRQLWIDALYEVVAECEVDGVPLVATWQLKSQGITKAEFEQQMQSRLSDEDLAYLLEYGW